MNDDKILNLSNTTAILLAAGNSERMGTNKMLLELCSKTAIEWSIRALVSAGIRSIIVTVSDATCPVVQSLSNTYCDVDIKTVFGGKTRAMSVLNALRVCPPCEIVIIHDAARCLVTPKIISASVRLACEHGCAIAMAPARDTIRSLYTHDIINREEYALIQTPQTFRYDTILKAYEAANLLDGTIQNQDDCAVYQRYGQEPYYFDEGILNQKLTYPSDILFFSAVLKERSDKICE